MEQHPADEPRSRVGSTEGASEKVLVTGANGFLGRAVVRELLDRGHSVRAMIRSGSPSCQSVHSSNERLEVFRADLCSSDNLEDAFEDVDILIHLAASKVRCGTNLSDPTLVGTRRLADAMARADTKRIVLASSLAVYDWSAPDGEFAEEAPIEADVLTRDPYSRMKIRQEGEIRRLSDRHGWALTVIRPGFIWGSGDEMAGAPAYRNGAVLVVIGPTARPPLTHVRNCASAFAHVAGQGDKSAGHTFNVVDCHDVTAWEYIGHHLRKTGSRSWRIPFPYPLGIAFVRVLDWSRRSVRGDGFRAETILSPSRFEARLRPIRFNHRRLSTVLGWSPPYTFEDCLRMTYPTGE